MHNAGAWVFGFGEGDSMNAAKLNALARAYEGFGLTPSDAFERAFYEVKKIKGAICTA